MLWKIAVASQLILLALVAHGQAPTCMVPPPGLISWWTGDVDATDLYGVNNPSGVNGVSLAPAEVLDGFSFGTGGYIDIAASPTLANQKFTWDAWVEPQGPGPNDDEYGSIIIGQTNDGEGATVQLAWRATDNRFLFLFDNDDHEIISSDTFPAGTFYLVAATYDGATFRLYVNGVLEGAYAETEKIAYSSSTWTIGSTDAYYRNNGLPRTWNGVIDEVQVFKYPAPAADIVTLFKAGSAGICKDPVVVTPSSLHFSWLSGYPPPPAKVVTIINNRNVTLTIDPFTITGRDPESFGVSSTNCGGTLPARESCEVDVVSTVAPKDPQSAVLDVNDSAAGSPQVVRLTATRQECQFGCQP